MAVPFDTPVTAIEGIGPAAEALFQAYGVYSVYDLLRAHSDELHGAVAALASFEEVRRWRQMAVMLEVAAVTPQWAEALVLGGVTSLTELRRLGLDELQALFVAAEAAGTIPDVPSASQAAAILADASLLDYAGCVTGTVSGPDGNPVAGASVEGGGRQMTSDDRGRFRLRRLRLDRPVRLHIEKPGLQPQSVTVAAVPTALVTVLQFGLTPAIAVPPRPSGGSAGTLSELGGDEMPPLLGRDVTSGEVPVGSLLSGDLLVLTEFYANGTDAKLVSKLLDFDGSRFVARWVRLPKADLPAGAGVDDHFIKTPSGFRRVAMSPRKLAEYKRYLRALRSLPPGVAVTAVERAARVRAVLAGLQEGAS